MAFALHWKIPFRSLRSGIVYTVNIYKNATPPSGYPLTLKGGAQPFTTQEDDNDDMFTPVRTHTGYIRIVDDNYAVNANNTTVSFNWKDLLPSTDTDRPVTLTDGNGTVMWQGFMQAQNFGGTLYGNPQEREFPVHCPLTILEGTDINYQQTQIQNFAYLIKQIVTCITTQGDGAISIDNIIVQGSADAQQWLLKRIDWQNFSDEDGDGNLTARFNLFQILEDVCRFWGWTARTYRRNIYLVCPDDTSESNFLALSMSDLGYMANGTSAGQTGGSFSTIALTGDIFASTDQDDFRQRGPNRAAVKADTNRGNDAVLDVFNGKTIKAMKDMGEQSSMIHYVLYTNDLLQVDQPYIKIQCREGCASLNIGSFGYAYNAPYVNVIRIKQTGGNSVTPYVTIETGFEHCFNDGFLRMFGQTYRFTEEYLDPYGEFVIGRSHMYARIAIGKDKQHAKWWNGQSWQDTTTYCRISIGNKANNLDDNKNEFMFLYLQESQASVDDWGCNILPVDGLQGKLFIDLLGTSDSRVPVIDGQRSFELKDFKIEFTRNPGVVKHGSASDMIYAEEIDRPTSFEYKSSNQNNVRMDWNADCIYATENGFKFSYGELINQNGTFTETVPYNGTSRRPEQHLADRVTAYWSAAKRKLEMELRSNITRNSTLLRDIMPQNKVTIDGTTCYPLAVGHEWRDDVTSIKLIQLT